MCRSYILAIQNSLTIPNGWDPNCISFVLIVVQWHLSFREGTTERSLRLLLNVLNWYRIYVRVWTQFEISTSVNVCVEIVQVKYIGT